MSTNPLGAIALTGYLLQYHRLFNTPQFLKRWQQMPVAAEAFIDLSGPRFLKEFLPAAIETRSMKNGMATHRGLVALLDDCAEPPVKFRALLRIAERTMGEPV
jgi:hypothetical protein